VDGWWSRVLDAVMGGSLYEVGVVAGTFDDSGIGAVTAARVFLSGHVGQCLGECFLGVFRGKSPLASPLAGG
jgi:hypothetical protein